MNKKGLLARTAVGALGGVLLLGMAGVAVAAEVQDDEVAVNVTISPIAPVGALTMSVASNTTSLTEVDSGDAAVREFGGTLPTVTISDDREDVPADVFWYVTGQSSAFTGPGTITADHLGWTPALLTTVGDGEVAEGPEVLTSLDAPPNNVGLVAEELLALNVTDSQDASTVGTWTANAALTLKTPVTQAPGAYTGTITLTLWEDAL